MNLWSKQLMSNGLMGIVILAVVSSAMAGYPTDNLVIRPIETTGIQWGPSDIYMDIHNVRPDSAQVIVRISTTYKDHYMCSDDYLDFDTSFVVAPESDDKYKVTFEVPGAFGMSVTTALIWWEYFDPQPDWQARDSVRKVFTGRFITTEAAAQYSERRHNIGPYAANIGTTLLNWEFPRLVLYMTAKGKTLHDISRELIVRQEYVRIIYDRLAAAGFYPDEEEPYRPEILAVSEGEAFKIREMLPEIVGVVSEWYREHKSSPKAILSKKIDPEQNGIALQLLISLAMLHSALIDNDAGMNGCSREESYRKAIEPGWIVQGGEFFMPRLCLVPFAFNDDTKAIYWTVVRPDPNAAIDVEPITNTRAYVELNRAEIPTVKADMWCDKNPAGGEYRELLNRLNKHACEIAHTGDTSFNSSMMLNYILRLAMGEYFKDKLPPDGSLDCIRVEYSQ